MYWDIQREGGFDFTNLNRNQSIEKGQKVVYTKTGTTIVGCVYNGGVVLGADTRATTGSIVADPDSIKIHYLAPNMYCCGAGTAADLRMVTRMMASELEMQRLYTGRESRISHAECRLVNHLFKHMGYIGAALIIGGVDVTGPHLVQIDPYGCHKRLPFITMGSGSLAAMSVLEIGYKDNMTKEEAVNLVKDAIEAGIFNDEGSGSNVNVFVVTREGCEKLMHYRVYNKKEFHDPNMHRFNNGITKVIEEVKKNWKSVKVEEGALPMDLE